MQETGKVEGVSEKRKMAHLSEFLTEDSLARSADSRKWSRFDIPFESLNRRAECPNYLRRGKATNLSSTQSDKDGK
jgi:hypothetical protein